MSYIELINRFWILHEEVGFSTTAVALYFYLLKVNNALSWKSSFKRNNAKTQADLTVHRKKLLEAKKELANAGLISFTTSKTNGNVTYTILKNNLTIEESTKEVTNQVAKTIAKEVTKHATKSNPKEGTKEVAKVVALKLDIDKEEDKDIDKNKETKKAGSFEKSSSGTKISSAKTKTKKKVAPKKKVETSLEGEWAALMNRFLEHRLLLGSPIKTPQGIKARENRLLQLSNNDLQLAKKILNQTIENEWKDFYPLKNGGYENNRSAVSANQPIVNATANHTEEEAL
ncbi:hypothetical protein K4L44_05940 [Halosquirtibacter laminarini]|uniref:Uncharacterized protein n=1 Tax=Halosquirtibacter laminarini TaxID=3374600 RepID=A0AC61NI63_9BACT|nr:hypothetical protein K4L44_05940 [Prolixibacteraceae bacterium]